MLHRLPRLTAFLLATFMLLAAAAAGADTVRFGPRSLNIPSPAGFEPIAAVSPSLMQTMQAYESASNRLAEIYATPVDVKTLTAGEKPELGRLFILGVMRTYDGVAISNKEFQDAKQQIEAGFEEASKNTHELDAQIQQGNAKVEQMTSVDPKVALSAVEYLGVYRREPWGLFFTIKHGINAANGVDKTVVVGSAVVLVNHQLLFLYAYSRFDNESGRRWAEQSVSAWADAVRAANPDDPYIAAAGQSLGLTVVGQAIEEFWLPIVMALIAALVVAAAVAWLAVRKRDQRNQ